MDYFQKKRELQKDGRMANRFRTRSRVILAIVCVLMLVMTAGCGKAEEPVPVDLSSGDMEELQNENDRDTEADDASENGKGDMENEAAAETGADGKDDAENGKAEKAGQNADEENGTDAQSAGNEQLEGDVRRVESDSFVICKHETWVEDDASYAVASAPGNEEESDLVTIHMAENCVYQYKTVKNSGMNPEDVSSREGSFADVKEGLAVTIKGSWQADGSFLADSIEMFVFE